MNKLPKALPAESRTPQAFTSDAYIMDTSNNDLTATVTLDPTPNVAPHDADTRSAAAEQLVLVLGVPVLGVPVLGVDVADVSKHEALQLIEEMIGQWDGRTRSVFFVNTHTLNMAAADGEYRRILQTGNCVFGDGTGVRWAARLNGVRLKDNVCGTDLIPELLAKATSSEYRYFLLGADEQSIRRAARYTAANFSNWTQAGYHHGYLGDDAQSRRVVELINEAKPHVLLVGMGNPLQEKWIHRYQHELKVPVCIAVGGLFSYWAGTLHRTPAWLRQRGWEWLGILLQQPNKAKRYLLGNPIFLWRIFREARKRRHSQ